MVVVLVVTELAVFDDEVDALVVAAVETVAEDEADVVAGAAVRSLLTSGAGA